MLLQRQPHEYRLMYEMYRLYDNGKSTRDLVKIYGIKYHRVCSLLKEFGAQMNKRRSLSVKASGRPSGRKGIRASEETREKMRGLDRSSWKTTKVRIS